jgi:antibiotic biosynthesis monooxygenase (ABM) superfamily enzyme
MTARNETFPAVLPRRREPVCSDRPLPAREPKHRTILITWLAIWPLVTTVLAIGGPLGLTSVPLVLRTLVLTAIVVPAAVLLVVPGIRRALR